MTTSTPIESTMAYLMLIAEREEDTPEILIDWIATNLALSKFTEGRSHFMMMLDSSIIIFTELPDEEINAAVFATPSAMRDALVSNGPEFADIDQLMIAELTRINSLVVTTIKLLDAANSTEVGHA